MSAESGDIRPRYGAWWTGLCLLGIVVPLALLGTAVALRPDPRGLGTHEGLGLPPCGYLELTGRPCVSCGMTTSFAHTVRGQLPSALRANAVGTALALLCMVSPAWCIRSWRLRRDPLRFLEHRLGRWLLPALAMATVLLWAVRVGLIGE